MRVEDEVVGRDPREIEIGWDMARDAFMDHEPI